jgi:soluble lytic murein transglycosylase-like protein
LTSNGELQTQLRAVTWRRAGFVLLAMLVAVPASAEIERSVGKDGVIDLNNSRDAAKARALRKEGKSLDAVPPVQAVMPSTNSSELAERYDDPIREAATLYHLPEGLIRAVIHAESNFDPRVVSPANAKGLMQLLPSVAERMMVTDIMDPRQNILGGSRYLRVLANTFNGNLQLTVAAYNAGAGAVARYGGIPPYAETQAYVAKVLEYYQEYRE